MEQKIYDYLCQNCRGKDNMVSNRELRKIFNISGDKKLRDIIKNIRKDPKKLEVVGSKSGKTGGYWIANTKSDCIETCENLTHRANDIYKTAHVIKWKAEKKYGEI